MKLLNQVTLPTVEDYQGFTEKKELTRLTCGLKPGDAYTCFVPFLNDLDDIYHYSKNYKGTYAGLNPLLKKEIRNNFLSQLDDLMAFLGSERTCHGCIVKDIDGRLADPGNAELLRSFSMENTDRSKVRVYAAFQNEPDKLKWVLSTIEKFKGQYVQIIRDLKSALLKNIILTPMKEVKAFLQEIKENSLE